MVIILTDNFPVAYKKLIIKKDIALIEKVISPL